MHRFYTHLPLYYLMAVCRTEIGQLNMIKAKSGACREQMDFKRVGSSTYSGCDGQDSFSWGATYLFPDVRSK